MKTSLMLLCCLYLQITGCQDLTSNTAPTLSPEGFPVHDRGPTPEQQIYNPSWHNGFK